MLSLPEHLREAAHQSVIEELAAVQRELQDDIQSYVQTYDVAVDKQITVQPLTMNSFLIQPVGSQLVAYLQGKNWDADLSGPVALAKMKRRHRNRRSRIHGKVKPKDISPEQKVRKGLKEGKTLSLKHFDDLAAFNMVKKIFHEYIESDNFALFPVFMKELDDLVAVYRLRVGHEELDLPNEIEQEAAPFEDETEKDN